MNFSSDLEDIPEAGCRYRKGTVTFSFTPSSGSIGGEACHRPGCILLFKRSLREGGARQFKILKTINKI